MNQCQKRIIAAVVVGIAIVSAIYIPIHKDAVVHTACVSLLLAVFLSGASLWQLENKVKEDYITNLAFPLALKSYLCVTAVMAVLFVLLDLTGVWAIQFSWYAALQVIIIGITAWKVLAIGAAQEAILQTGEQVQANVSNWKLILADVDAMLKTVPNDIRRDVSEVRDAIRYADPMSRPEVEPQEKEISAILGQLKETLRENKSDEAKKLCAQIKDAVADRANRLKILK
ncbi:MAG: hypothetical protein IJS08_11175 [Victivallales bacterium]|nr:hypothetical protein [Victivallales bacterium]